MQVKSINYIRKKGNWLKIKIPPEGLVFCTGIPLNLFHVQLVVGASIYLKIWTLIKGIG